MNSNLHVFALLVEGFWQGNEQLHGVKLLSDDEVVHRLVKVLRCELHDTFIFFDRKYHGLLEVVQVSKKDLTLKILSFQANVTSQPYSTFLLPLLKKEALEEAVYSLCELGIDQIQLVVTQKSRQKLLHAKEFERLQNIVIAAAEQSKNYIYSILHEPKKLSDIVSQMDIARSSGIVFDGAGQSFFQLREAVALNKEVVLLVGPEGGLTEQEIEMVKKMRFVSCCLTSTTLRAVQAVAVGASLVRLR